MVGMTSKYKIIPEWSIPKELFLVWPRGIPKRNHLIPNFLNLIKQIPNTLGLSLIINKREQQNEINKLLIENEIHKSVSYIDIPFSSDSEAYDIWIRDWAPLCAIDDSGNRVYLKAKYHPQYLSPREAELCDNTGRLLPDLLNEETILFPLIWDLGNFTHNGNGIGIVTSRIITDNNSFSKINIHDLFNQMLGINKLIFIDEEPGDATGHVDGLIRFISKNKLVISRYPPDCFEENKFIDSVKKHIKMELGSSFEFIDIPNGLFSDESNEGIQSSFGNHINYLHLGTHLLMPIYGIDSDDAALSIIKKSLPHTKIIPIESSILSHKGGVLNCISWCLY